MASRSSNNIRFMPSNMLTVMILLMSLLTNSVDNFLTLLNENGVNNLLASCLGDLARVLMGMLVALLLLLVFTLRTTVVSIFSSISCPLVVTIMTIVISMVLINNPGVVSNNTRMVITRLLFFMAVGLGHILTLLNISNIYNNFIINITFFMFLFFWYLMALLVLLVMTMRTIMLLILNMSMVTLARISCTRHKSNRQEGN